MKCFQDTSQERSAGGKRFGLLLAAVSAIAVIVFVLLAAHGHSASPSKALSAPPSSESELGSEGHCPPNLDRFNLSNSSEPTKQEVMRIVKAWMEGNATLAEARLAIALWRNSSAATTDH
jgi:hypothetical protein